ncbi:hypothetical protein BCR44DRAFT_1231794 [Catenaria anguillulae PL171]|uniref:Uncharacterized protein n=1 Tax=Catenaria anguillulae PL171 TaxID=765915 RepID=A0A1Y2HDQ7_9FUNG|nr:hypothetical protein BCR44DRAFT_1231794 [Catenaria anguillulae PL171]
MVPRPDPPSKTKRNAQTAEFLRPASKPRSRPQTPASGSRPQTPSATTARTRQASDSPGAATNAANDDDGDDRDSTLQSSTTSLSTSTQTNVPPGGVPSRGASWLSLFATSSTSPNPSSPLTSPSSSSSRSSSAPLADAPLVVGHLGHATNAHLKRVAATQRKLSTLVVDVQGQVTGVAGEAVLRARRAGAVVSGVRDYVGLQSRMDALDKELEELIFKVGEVVGKDKVKFLDPASESETEHEDGTSIPNA